MADKESRRGVLPNGKLIDSLRKRKGWTIEDFATGTRFKSRTAQKAIAGHSVDIESLKEMADRLGETYESLLLVPVSGATQPTVVTPLFQLPAEVADFTGREEEIRLMVGRLDGESGRVGLSALRGMGGIGKTSLAVKVAHLVKDRFPDGQLLLDLQGMSDKPMTSVAAMSRIIRDFHPTIQTLPENEADLLPIYRSTLAGKKVLILLDNARDEGQVQHLVTVSPPVGFVVTSRNALALDGVESVSLGVLSPTEALGLLRGIVKGKGADDELRAVAGLCGYLPLALRVAGDFLRLYPNWSVSRYTEALSDENGRLVRLKGKTKEKDVEAVLALSARQLVIESETLAARWQMLSVIPCNFPPIVAAAVWGVRINGSLDYESTLDDLTLLLDHSLIQFSDGDNYTFHDLLRPVAKDTFLYVEHHRLASSSQIRLQVAEHRMKEGCLAAIADSVLEANGYFASRERLLNFISSQLKLKGKEVFDLNVGILFGMDRPPRETMTNGTPKGSGYRHENRGNVMQALVCYEEWLRMAKETNDQSEEAKALLAIGRMYLCLDAKKAVVDYFEPALRMSREIRNSSTEAWALLDLAKSPPAITGIDPTEYAKASRALFERIDDQLGHEAAMDLLNLL